LKEGLEARYKLCIAIKRLGIEVGKLEHHRPELFTQDTSYINELFKVTFAVQ
jgi:hypothetical protein